MAYQPKTLDIDKIKRRPILADMTIVIPTLGRPILEEALWWLTQGRAWPAGLIVVDQGPNPDIESWLTTLRDLGIKTVYVSVPRRGRAAGVNRGLERVQTRFVAVTDDDCFAEADWLENMAQKLRANPTAIVTGRVEAGSEGVMAVTSPTPAIYHRPRLKFDAMSGGNMGTSLTVIERVGLFDEDVTVRTAEDGEWAYRALRRGVPLIYAPEIGVTHIGWRDEAKRDIQYQDYARSHGGFYGKYLRQGDWFIALRATLHHLRALRRWVIGWLTNDSEKVLYGRAYVTGLLPGIVAGLRRGRQ